MWIEKGVNLSLSSKSNVCAKSWVEESTDTGKVILIDCNSQAAIEMPVRIEKDICNWRTEHSRTELRSLWILGEEKHRDGGRKRWRENREMRNCEYQRRERMNREEWSGIEGVQFCPWPLSAYLKFQNKNSENLELLRNLGLGKHKRWPIMMRKGFNTRSDAHCSYCAAKYKNRDPVLNIEWWIKFNGPWWLKYVEILFGALIHNFWRPNPHFL